MLSKIVLLTAFSIFSINECYSLGFCKPKCGLPLVRINYYRLRLIFLFLIFIFLPPNEPPLSPLNLPPFYSPGEICNCCFVQLAVPPCVPVPLPMGLPCGEPICECGPQPTPLPIIQAPPVTVPTIQGPIIPLPSPPIPCPRTIAHRCICTKTVVKPQLIQRCITVPTIQRYLKRTYTPVIENIAYKTKPKCCCAARAAAAAAPVPVPPPLPLSLPYSRIC